MGAIREFFDSLLLRELVKGLALTGRYAFSRKITIQYPEEKPDQPALSRTARVAPLSERAAASLASCAKRCARRLPSRSNQTNEKTARGARHATTST